MAGFGMDGSVDVDADEDRLPLEFDVFNRQHLWHGVQFGPTLHQLYALRKKMRA